LHGDICSGAHCHADIGFGEGRGVVDAIAGHGDRAAFGSQAPDNGILLFREHLGFDFGDPEFPGDRLRGCTIIAGEHHDANSVRAQPRQGVRSRRLDRIGDRDDAGRPAVNSDKHRGCALLAERVGARFQCGAPRGTRPLVLISLCVRESRLPIQASKEHPR
jgi:hypothetical protein